MDSDDYLDAAAAAVWIGSARNERSFLLGKHWTNKMKDGFIRVAAATRRIHVADCAYNVGEAIRIAKKAECDSVRVLVFPELCLTAYTCSDLFFMKTLTDSALDALRRYLRETAELDMLSMIGLPVVHRDKLYNCAAICLRGKLLGLVPKSCIPNYSEFYEARHFAPVPSENDILHFDGYDVPFGSKLLFACDTMPSLRIAAEICEDLWVPVPPSSAHALAGATLLCNLSASNETIGKDDYRRLLVTSHSARMLAGYVYASSGDGESTNDIVFSGHDLIAENGTVLAEKKPFAEEEYIISEIDTERLVRERSRINTFSARLPEGYVEIHFSLTPQETPLSRWVDPHPFVPADSRERTRRCETILSIQAHGLAQRIERAYARKCVIGISGGLDSCLAMLVTARAMDLLGRPRTDVIGVTMPCFGTTKRTKSNAVVLCEEMGVTFREVDIADAVQVHFRDIGHSPEVHNVVYENVQARERTQVLMDVANAEGGIVVGTGDLSELALGWATYNGDHMSMYGVNASVPKTLVRHIVAFYADREEEKGNARLAQALRDILDTPVSPELLPADENGEISQKTEDLVGPYELHDFYLYYMLRFGFSPAKLYRLARYALGETYDATTMKIWLITFVRRFFAQQFKRTCLPDGPKVGSVALSPRGDWRMPSDAVAAVWIAEAEHVQP